MARYIDIDAVSDDYMQSFTANADTYLVVRKILRSVPVADVEEIKCGENIGTLHPVDEFVCSECGIVLEGWTRVIIDEDDGEMFFYEYEFKYCPNCGAKMSVNYGSSKTERK